MQVQGVGSTGRALHPRRFWPPWSPQRPRSLVRRPAPFSSSASRQRHVRAESARLDRHRVSRQRHRSGGHRPPLPRRPSQGLGLHAASGRRQRWDGVRLVQGPASRRLQVLRLRRSDPQYQVPPVPHSRLGGQEPDRLRQLYRRQVGDDPGRNDGGKASGRQVNTHTHGRRLLISRAPARTRPRLRCCRQPRGRWRRSRTPRSGSLAEIEGS